MDAFFASVESTWPHKPLSAETVSVMFFAAEYAPANDAETSSPPIP